MATFEDWRALPEEAAVELLAGRLIEMGPATFGLGHARACVAEALTAASRERWRIATRVDVALGPDIVRPDLAGWTRERVRSADGRARPFHVRPDWICEIVGDTHRVTSKVTKLNRYHQARVPHYWILDQFSRTLTVHRHAADGYIVVLAAAAEERVRAEPFGEIELHVGALLGLDERTTP